MDLFKGGRVNNKNTKKIVFLWVFPVLLLLLIVVRVAYLQLWCSVALKNKSQKNLYRKEFIPP
ncbi:hypothetical protein KAU11_04150, partial [Candidatus Babeliales bacterium]|nr:hypothetical protein [Candidatus Babeliales bacterium]